jgi:hypothetical protein
MHGGPHPPNPHPPPTRPLLRLRVVRQDVEDAIPVKRLLVQFDKLGKTVKSKVSPLLYDYFEEVVLSFGVNIVTFKTSRVLQQVQRILEAQPGGWSGLVGIG